MATAGAGDVGAALKRLLRLPAVPPEGDSELFAGGAVACPHGCAFQAESLPRTPPCDLKPEP